MRGRRAHIPGFIGILAILFVPFLAAQTRGRHIGQDVKTIDLDPHPDSMVLVAARKAFLQGDIVRIVGGRPEDLQRLLGIGGAILTPRSSAVASNRFDIQKQKASAPIYQIVAARSTRTGALHEFQQLGTESIAASNSVQLAGFDTWAEKERLLAQKEETGFSPGDPEPPAQAWTELQQTTFSDNDQPGNSFQNTVSIFRLNDISPNFDWYMVLTDPSSTPHYQGCNGFDCGWWTNKRVFTMSTNPQAVLFDHGPLNTITTATASFSIGGLINAAGPGVNAAYSASWQQPSVTTTDQSDLVHGVGKWNEAFEGNGFGGSAPPETSIGVFLSHQGSIFQVPEGTTSFQFSLDEPQTYEYAGFNYTYSPLNAFFQASISPPTFEISLNSLSIPPGGSGSFEITAVNQSTSNSGLGLAWDVTNLPSWLTVSQTSGSSSARLILNVAPGTALGTVGSLNVNTNPAFAAPSVEKNPLLVRVTVGQPNETGVMLTGGTGSQRNPQALAQLYSPQLGQFDFGAAMQSPRSNHTATLLLSGELLLAGGAVSTDVGTATAETFDPNTTQFSSTAGMMADSRQFHTATLLQNGTVLLAGGIDNAGISGSGDALATAEIYDPVTRTFRATGSMAMQRLYHTSTGLLDGEVLIAGGVSNLLFPVARNTGEIYDPNTGRFTPADGNMISGVFYHTATLLKDGHVLIAGGLTATGASASAELYNPGTRTFSAVGNLSVARSLHTATLLPDGTVLIAGGMGIDDKELASAEIYNPESQSFTLLSNGPCPGSTGCMTTARTSHTATSLLDGTVLIAFGENLTDPLGSTEIYNPKTQTFSVGPSSVPTEGQTATLLQRPTTTIALTSSPNPSMADQKVTLTATVKTGDVVVPVGTVSLQDGANTLAIVPLQLSDNGVAVFSSTSLSVGPHSLTAKYSGDTAHGKSVSSIVVQSVKSQATTTMLRSSPNPSNDGQLVRFVATVTPAISGVPTGPVTFSNNGAPQQVVELTGNTATWTTRSLPPGANPITASYSGDPSFASSGSQVLTQNVAKLPSTITVTSSPNPASFGSDVLIKAIVTSTGDPLLGNVAFRDGVRNLRPVPLVSGVASFPVSNLSMGSHSITGTYSGDLTHAGKVSLPVLQKITAAVPTVSLSSSLNPSIYGKNVTFAATVSSGQGVPRGTVTFLDGSLRLGSRPLRNGVAALTAATLSAGMHQITAAYNGNGSHANATSPPLAQIVNKAPTTTIFSSAPNPSVPGQNVIFRAMVTSSSGSLPTGTVLIQDGMSALGKPALNAGVATFATSTLASGSHTVTASYDGNSNFLTSVSSPVVQKVGGLLTPTAVLTVIPRRAIDGATVIFTVRVSYPGGPAPTGSVTIADVSDGSKIYGVGPLNNGVAVIRNSNIPVKVTPYNLDATYGGDGGKSYTGATSNSVSLRISPGRATP